jgi:hypothetical protein
MVLGRAITMLKFVHAIKEVVNEDAELLEDTKSDTSYYMKIVDELGDESAKFTIGLKDGKWAIKQMQNPDVVIIITESAFFSVLRGTHTLEQIYFYGEADLWSKDQNPISHIVGIKSLFDKIETVARKKLEKL